MRLIIKKDYDSLGEAISGIRNISMQMDQGHKSGDGWKYVDPEEERNKNNPQGPSTVDTTPVGDKVENNGNSQPGANQGPTNDATDQSQTGNGSTGQ